MIEFLIVSNILLWLIMVAGAILLLGLTRQVGLLHERSAPLGALVTDHGPDIGEKSPVFNVMDYYGKSIQIGGQSVNGKASLMLFMSPNCPMCNRVLPTVKLLGKEEDLDVVLISDGERGDHDRFLEKHPQLVESIPYVVSSTIGMQLQVGKIPYAMLLDHEGTIRAKGLVNTREHLESLVEAYRTGYATLQEYLRDPETALKHQHPRDPEAGEAGEKLNGSDDDKDDKAVAETVVMQ